jgi:hypothetical protein
MITADRVAKGSWSPESKQNSAHDVKQVSLLAAKASTPLILKPVTRGRPKLLSCYFESRRWSSKLDVYKASLGQKLDQIRKHNNK